MSETSISRERAREILVANGQGDDYDPAADYYVMTTEGGDEQLMQGGLDAPLCRNQSTTSWLGSR